MLILVNIERDKHNDIYTHTHTSCRW